MHFRTDLIFEPEQIPEQWNVLIGKHNILLSAEFFTALTESQPENMENHLAVFYDGEILIGGAILQTLDFKDHSPFKNKSFLNLNNISLKTFAQKLLIVGNNLVTGQNGFYFDLDLISRPEAIKLLENAVNLIQKKTDKSDLILFKDYEKPVSEIIRESLHKNYQSFSVQPNMILDIRENWKSYNDYLNDFTTKYRTRAKSARKKLVDIIKRELNLDEVLHYEKTLYQLYLQVANEADFNTFILRENHFYSLKVHLKNNFKVFAYFEDQKMLSFYTLFINVNDVDTYFLGYEKTRQKSNQLYLNMLLDMVELAINFNKSSIIFGRTALEIKSTIGAKPQEIFGLVKHNNYILNLILKNAIPRLNPSKAWTARQPFKI